ncbi:hypothetical protein BuS5_00380 [Desulfosarcina sp. BuS5]|uniref:hybrid sensor histidine kinase/response regulator n=1 Tax=Desulfosarcina sp. BuS5 TaxID=933262 RepID=UPI0006854565|nr:hybrid sensor histidine kinase/response regulator [Desulfosarcina sp. BuS5]WDN87412.1 hypothetical protein BuS5_00380 [Desulfosarcina sp. BuS5]
MNSLQANSLNKLPDIEPGEIRDAFVDFMDYAFEGYLLFDKNLKLKLFNKATQAILGLSKKDVGKHITEIAPYLTNTNRLAKYKEIIITGESFAFTNISIEPHNKIRNIKAFKTGDDLGIIINDITELKQIEYDLIKQNVDIHRYVDNLITMNAKIDTGGVFIMINKKAAEAAGFKRSDIIGTKAWNGGWFNYDREIQKRVKKNIAKAALGERVFYEERLNTKAGLIDSEIRLSPVTSKAGVVSYIIIECHDISRLKMAEKKLLAAKEAAEEANIAKSDFLATMSHEIRTPMNGILGFADILLGDELNSDQRDAVETIKKSGENLLLLINNILDLSRIENNKIELESIPFNLEDLICEVGELTKTKLGEKPVEINCFIDDIPAGLIGDPTKLRQIITNLAGNAVKFTEKGEVLLSVSVAKETDKNILLDFSVRDSGIGIPPDKLETVFETFRQVDSSTTRKYGGSGLGLAISRKLAALMGGEMWVTSPAFSKKEKKTYGYGDGSIFHFATRFKKDLSGKTQKMQVDISGLEGKRVLIAENNQAALQILKNIIKKAKMIPVLAKTGAEALKVINNHPPEVAIIDLTLKDMAGTELAAKIDQITGEKTKLIALTPDHIPGSKSSKSKFAGLLSKPVRHRVMINMLRSLFGLLEEDTGKSRSIPIKKEIMAHAVKILYAEDNPVNQKVGEKMFKRMGYQIKIASDGLQALELVTGRDAYDIIFMDMQMPNMDGLQATREIRKWEKTLKKDISNQHTRIPIIALTANAMKGDREKCIQAGMDDYMSKPFKTEDIQKMVHKWSVKEKSFPSAVKSKRIIVVEDEEKIRKSIMRLIKRKMPGAIVMCAGDGIDATAKLGSFAPDLILTDIMMPKMDGIEFVKYIRSHARYDKTGIIVITGLNENADKVESVKNEGVDNLLFKPLANKLIIEEIQKVFARR